MASTDQVVTRVKRLIEEGRTLAKGTQHDQVRSESHRQQCAAWITSALNAISVICPNPDSAFRSRETWFANGCSHMTANRYVGELCAVLGNLLEEIDSGMLISVETSITAGVLDDFLDHAEVYHKAGKKDQAGVIAGVVFEDSVRKLSEKHGVNSQSAKLDDLISELAKLDVFTQTKAKRARAAADVRTKATHADWTKFDSNDVRATIEFTRELLREELEQP